LIRLPFLNHITFFGDFLVFLGGLLGRSIKYNRINPVKNNPINMYNISSTLLNKYLDGQKKPTD